MLAMLDIRCSMFGWVFEAGLGLGRIRDSAAACPETREYPWIVGLGKR
jgi:hypothetical protein